MTSSQSSSLASGMYSRRASIFAVWSLSGSSTRYLVRPNSCRPTPIMDGRLPGRRDLNRSRKEPDFRNFGVQPAYGPKSSPFLPSITRVSRCGTDIGGAPTRSEEHTSELQSRFDLVCRLLLEKKKSRALHEGWV